MRKDGVDDLGLEHRTCERCGRSYSAPLPRTLRAAMAAAAVSVAQAAVSAAASAVHSLDLGDEIAQHAAALTIAAGELDTAIGAAQRAGE